jgi:hypothetical protein
VRWHFGGSRPVREEDDAARSRAVVLCVAGDEAEATMMRGLLAENGIEAAIAAGGGLDLRSLYGAGGRCLLLVLPADLDEARALVASHFT